MSDDTTTDATQVEAEVESQVDDATTEANEADDEVLSQEDLKALQTSLKKANSEAAKYRKELRDAQSKLQQFEDADKSAVEKATGQVDALSKERDALTAQVRDLKAQAALGAAGAIAPDLLAVKLTDTAFDDDDAMSSEIKALKRRYPTLFRNLNGSGDGGAGIAGDAPDKADMNKLIRQAAGRE